MRDQRPICITPVTACHRFMLLTISQATSLLPKGPVYNCVFLDEETDLQPNSHGSDYARLTFRKQALNVSTIFLECNNLLQHKEFFYG